MGEPGTWRVESLRLKNFRQLDEFAIEFGPEVTLLVGMNGSGKTTVLDALAVMLSTLVDGLGGEPKHFAHSDARAVVTDLASAQRTATEEPQYPVVGAVHAVVDSTEMSWTRQLASSRGRTTRGDISIRKHVRDIRDRATAERPTVTSSSPLPVIAYYGVERLIGTRAGYGSIPSSRTGAYVTALDPRSDLTRLSSFLESLDGQILAAQAYGDETPNAALQQYEAIREACSSILQPVGWSKLRWNRGIGALTLSHPDQGTLPLASLASGTKIAAGLAIDLASRMARANPHLGSSDLLRDTPGIVLIDEVDLHLHPSWQQQILISLRRTFPRVQFIVSTHSPQVIATVESGEVRILRQDRVDIPSFAHGLLPETILAEVQDTDPKPDVPARARLDEYLKLVYRGEGRSDHAVRARDEIEQTLGGVTLNSELIDADAFMAYNDLTD